MEFNGGRLREMRLRARMTQAELARRVGVDRNTIHRWEGRDSMPSTKHLLDLWNALDCAVTYLLGLRDDPTRGVYLDASERALLDSYRLLSPAGRRQAREMLLALLQVQRATESGPRIRP